ncbi:uncharacterized protein LOC144472301 [Augochlora pura]
MDFPANVLNFVANWSYRRVISSPSFEGQRTMHKGLPQGGVLSPLLYNIYVSNIGKDLPRGIHISQYADDIAVFTRCTSLNDARHLMEAAIENIGNSLISVGLELAPKKTKLVVFSSRKKYAQGMIAVQVNGHTIKNEDSVVFLGLHLDRALNFREHINVVHAQCSRVINIIKFLRGVWWGAHPDTLITIYKSMIRSRLDYGSKHLVRKLESVQTRALKLAMGLRMSTPNNVVLAEAGIPHLRERAAYLGKTHLVKVMSNRSHASIPYIEEVSRSFRMMGTSIYNNTSRVFQECVREVMNIVNICQVDTNYACQTINLKEALSAAECDIETGAYLLNTQSPNRELEGLVRTKYGNHVGIYTDGSKISSGISTGAAVVCPGRNYGSSFSMNSKCSVFTAECAAISEAVSLALNNCKNSYVIFSDSLSAITCLNSTRINVKTNKYIIDIKQKLATYKAISGKNRIIFMWIPSHCGITGNEQADEMAKEATQEPHNPELGVPFTDFREQFKETMWENFQRTLEIEFKYKGTNYYNTLYESRKKPWYTKQNNWSRETIVRIGSLRSNHYNTGESLARVGIINSPQCECSHPVQDLNHIIWQCPLRDNGRNEYVRPK